MGGKASTEERFEILKKISYAAAGQRVAPTVGRVAGVRAIKECCAEKNLISSSPPMPWLLILASRGSSAS